MSFVHLHLHTHYSFLQWLGKPADFVKEAKNLEMPGLAITDAGNMYGAFEFYKKAKDAGINPIIGVEATISKKGRSNRDKDNELYEIVLLAKTFEGYQNLLAMTTEAWLHGMYNGRPRIDFDLLRQYSGDLIALSGSILGEIPQHITTGKSDEFIRERIEYYREIFGADDFYLEIQEHPDRGNQPKINEKLVALSRAHGYKLVATNHAYYANAADAEAQDLFYCIGDGRSLEDPDRPSLVNGNYAIRSAQEMEELFAYAPEAVKNTLEISEKIHISIPYGQTLIPVFELAEEESRLYEEYRKSVEKRNSPHPLTPSPLGGEGELISRSEAKSPEYIFALAQDLRKKSTNTEEIMWELLRNRNFLGCKFRRQHPIGRYIADFYSEELRLVIEIDGKIHGDITQQEYDSIRDDELKNRWLQIYRIKNSNILEDLEQTLKNLRDFLAPLSSEGEGLGVRQEDNLALLGKEEWNLRNLCIRGIESRYEIGMTEEIILECIHKKSLPRTDRKLSDISALELQEMARTFYTDRKREMLAALDATGKKGRNIDFTPSQIVDRLEYELLVVDLMGFNGYFNIVSDFIVWAKKNGVPVGPGRGSAAGAILAYLSGITDLDPLRYALLFERFLNPSRVSMPDIDVDFSDEGRERVLEYVRNKYGEERVVQVCTFGTMAARAAVKDVGKVLGIPFSDMNKFAQLIPSKPGTKIKDALEESIEFKKAYDTDERYHKIIDNALRLEGSIRQLGVHACAVIIAPEPMVHFCPLQHPPKDVVTTVTQFSAKPLEDLGLLKMDFLGLRNLTIIDRCLRIIKNVHGIELDMLRIPYDDQKAFRVFSEGETTGVFQFESAGMRKYLKELKPNTFEDIIAMVALYRPGPMAFIPVYIRRKFGQEKVSYMMDELRDILTKLYGKEVVKEETKKLERDLGPYLDVSYGIAVYQEQLMQLAQSMGGFSLGEADVLRRWVGKKIREVVEKIKIDFVEKAAQVHGYKPETSAFIYEKMVMPAADYSFNKSHAACYAMIAYQTAYLKAYYPTEFMTALMVSDEEDTERITLEIEECNRKGISILPPDVNESMKHFTYIDPKHIRFGLKAIKGLGDGPIESIRAGRESAPYETILDLLERTNSDVINKKSLESLTLSGALDRFGERASILASIPKMTAFHKENEKKAATSQIGLFDLGHADTAHLKFSLERAKPMTFEEMIRGEKQSIGYSVTGHGLDGLGRFVAKRTIGKEHVVTFKKELAERALSVHEFEDDETGEGVTTVVENTTSPQTESDDATIDTPEETIAAKKETGKKKREKEKKVRFMGLITSARQVQTKTNKMMAIATCDSADFQFTIVVFPKDYEKLSHLLEVDKIALVEGNFQWNLENGEISVMAQNIRTISITALRQQAMDMGLFDPKLKVRLHGEIEEENWELRTESWEWRLSVAGENWKNDASFRNFSSTLSQETSEISSEKYSETSAYHERGEESLLKVDPETPAMAGSGSQKPSTWELENPKIWIPTHSSEYLIAVPAHATKQDLLDLKEFLSSQEPWNIRIWLDIRGNRVDTKLSITNEGNVERWAENRWDK